MEEQTVHTLEVRAHNHGETEAAGLEKTRQVTTIGGLSGALTLCPLT